MATSTNYGWAEPDNSSLVKNGASDIRTLGNAIDTSVWNVGFGQAGKNKVINGDFTINQRSFTSNTTNNAYNFDRWLQQNSGGTFTITPQSFTAGAAPLAGYEATTYVQGVTATQSAAGDYAIVTQKIENVRTFAGNSITISFYAKANTGTPKIGIEVQQNFGSGGSPSAAVSAPAGAVTLTTSWARYSVTVAVPSISGKTIGSTANSSYLELNLWTSAGATYATRASSVGVQNFTASIWGVQAEYGSLATPFQISTGTIQGELSACMRYYQKSYQQGQAPGTNTANGADRFRAEANTGQFVIDTARRFIMPLRVSPTFTWYSTAGNSGNISVNGSNVAVSATYDYSSTVSPYAYTASSISASADVQWHWVAEAEL